MKTRGACAVNGGVDGTTVIAFPSNTVAGRIFLAINPQGTSEDAESALLTAEDAERLGLALLRQAWEVDVEPEAEADIDRLRRVGIDGFGEVE